MARFSDGRIRAIIQGPRVFRTYPFPGAPKDAGVTVSVRVLTEAEMDGCRVAAQEAVRKMARKRGWKPEHYLEIDPHAFDRAIERQVTFRSTFDPETIEDSDPVRFFESPEDIQKLDTVTTTALVGLYLEHQEWVSPLALLEDEEVDELTAALGKEPEPEVYLARFAPSTLRRCVISLASRLRGSTSPTNKSCGGSS